MQVIVSVVMTTTISMVKLTVPNTNVTCHVAVMVARYVEEDGLIKCTELVRHY